MLFAPSYLLFAPSYLLFAYFYFLVVPAVHVGRLRALELNLLVAERAHVGLSLSRQLFGSRIYPEE